MPTNPYIPLKKPGSVKSIADEFKKLPTNLTPALRLARAKGWLKEINKQFNDNFVILDAKLELINKGFTDIQAKIEEAKLLSGSDSLIGNTLNELTYLLEQITPALNNYAVASQNVLDDFAKNTNSIKYPKKVLTLIDDLKKRNEEVKNRKLMFERRLTELKKRLAGLNTGRSKLSASNPVDWDETPTLYENTSIALGHLLMIKQVWKNDGYSIGDVEGSIVLQPMQIKQVATVDWTRNDTASRSEEIANTEALTNTVSRQSDSQEIIKTALGEDISGSSKSKSRSSGFSIGGSASGPIGPAIVGISGGYQSSKQSASSSSTQNSSRDLSSNALQSLRDRIQQSAASVRSQRSTVIQTVSESEAVTATTEVIANYNRRHAMTTMWFGINRHFVIEQEIADVQECLFFPLPMSEFNTEKVYRWKDILEDHLIDGSLKKSFEAVERIATNYENINFPEGRYCDEPIDYIEGDFMISFEIPRIPDPDENEMDAAIKSNDDVRINTATTNLNQYIYDLYNPFYILFRKRYTNPRDLYLTKLKKEIKEKRDYTFEKEIVPVMVNTIVDDFLKIHVKDENATPLSVDFTLVDKYETLVSMNNRKNSNGQYEVKTPKGRPLKVRFRTTGNLSLTRDSIKNLILSVVPDDQQFLPDGVRIIVHSAKVKYSTSYGDYNLFTDHDLKDDLNTKPGDASPSYDTCEMPTSKKSFRELQFPKMDDRMMAARLISHLNQHIEKYHNILWMNMDNNRLFRLLDGYIAPNSNGRSVASVVESQPLGVIGNNLILKVVPGANLDPYYYLDNEEGTTLLDHYKPSKPSEPFRITVKNPGLYGESILGKCESAETIDDSKLWRYEDLKIPYLPTAIQPVSTDSRYVDPGNLQAKDFAQPMINMQTLTPDSLKESALKDALSLIGKGDAFRDATGLAGTQQLVGNAQNQNTQILKNATDAANTAMQTGANYSIEKQKQDLAAYESFSKNASPQEKKALQQAFMDKWGVNNKAVENAIGGANEIAKKQTEIAADRSASSTLKQALDSAEPGSEIEAKVNADGSAELKMTKNVNSTIQWVKNNSERLLEYARKYDLTQKGKAGQENVCWAYALAITLYPAIEFDKFSSNESIIEQILKLAEDNEEEPIIDDGHGDHDGTGDEDPIDSED